MRNHLFRRLYFCIGMVLGGLFIFAPILFGQEQEIDWDGLETAARTYVEYPSSENASQFWAALPEQPLRGRFDTERYTRFAEYVFDNLRVLGRQISVGDPNAVKLGFRLYNVASGIYAVELDCIMGDLARSHPRLFLEELTSSLNGQHIRNLGYPVDLSTFLRDERWKSAHRYELEMRIKALESVTDDPLVRLRDVCVRQIKESLAKFYPNSKRVILGEEEYQGLFRMAVSDIYNEAALANEVCKGVIEIEDTANEGPFGAASKKLIHSSGVYDQLTAANQRSKSMWEAAGNPPLAYKDEYSMLEGMFISAYRLFRIAADPSFIAVLRSGDEDMKSAYKSSATQNYNEFRSAYMKLVALMPDIDNEVQKGIIDLEYINIEQGKQEKEDVINWDEAKQASDAYNACPTKNNAQRLLSTIPEKPTVHQLGNRKGAFLSLIENGPFYKAVNAGNEPLAEAAFRLLGFFGGGALDEELRIALGRFLTKKPAIFLELLKTHLYLFPSEEDYPVTMTEIQEIVPDITSDEDRVRMKRVLADLYTERIKALKGVEEPELTELRDICIRVIREIISRL